MPRSACSPPACPPSCSSRRSTPLDVVVSELVIEAFYPADEPTAQALGVKRVI
jgi:hypothetical protein